MNELEVTPDGKKIDHPPTGCFTGDTRIALVNGETISFSELYKNGFGNKWCYSIDLDKREISPGKIVNCFITKYVNKLVEVELDNGEKYRCTPDHLHMLKNGEFKPISDIVRTDSLMPLYTSYPTKGLTRYRMVLNPFTNKRCYEHRKFCCEIDSPKATLVHHKIVKVRNIVLDTPEPVYDIEVEKYHNFALSAGVFVHNSKDISDATGGSVARALANADKYKYINEFDKAETNNSEDVSEEIADMFWGGSVNF